jgi:hypothetical protein
MEHDERTQSSHAERVAHYTQRLDVMLATLSDSQMAKAHDLSDVMAKDKHSDAQLVGAIARLRIAVERLRREQTGSN